MNSEKQIVYLLLQNKYLKNLGLDNVPKEELLKRKSIIFPDKWFSLDIDKQIEYIMFAIDRNQTLDIVLKDLSI